MSIKSLLQTIVNEQGGFLLQTQIEELATLDRLRNVLVRCGNGRFSCPAQDALHFIGIIEAQRNNPDCVLADYVRDVSLLASDDAHRGVWRLHSFEGECRPTPAPRPAERKLGPFPAHTQFKEECCGGAFDGISVTSDADPGL